MRIVLKLKRGGGEVFFEGPPSFVIPHLLRHWLRAWRHLSGVAIRWT